MNQGTDLHLPLPSGESTTARVWGPDRSAAQLGIVFVSGVNGGYEQPADMLYERFAAEYGAAGVPSIHVRYRYPGYLEQSVQDGEAAANYLRQRGVRRMAVVGWSFGGAVAVHLGVRVPEVATVVTLSAQSRDTEVLHWFHGKSILVVHSRADENVPFYAAEQILEQVPSSSAREWYWLDDHDHLLDGASDLIDPVFRNWIRRKLFLGETVRLQPADRALVPDRHDELPLVMDQRP
ncbi:MAG TPA: dienelactone hydrolase family protein [Bdellovibrionota bacterium]|nr:dienelactone hydrolase family protein [Bdellovibrionota bacterium]